jgi:hypothetical protein
LVLGTDGAAIDGAAADGLAIDGAATAWGGADEASTTAVMERAPDGDA